MKVTFGALTLIAAGAAVFYGIRSNGAVLSRLLRRASLFIHVLILPAAPPPKTITAEWREAFEQRQMAETIDPITGKPPRLHFITEH